MQQPVRPNDLPVSFVLKRGTLFGAGLGMLAGLIYLAAAGTNAGRTTASIVLWRNLILIGAAAGFALAALVAWRLRAGDPKAPDTGHEHKPSQRVTNRSESNP